MNKIFRVYIDLRIKFIVIFHPFGEISVLFIETSVDYSDSWFVRRSWNRRNELIVDLVRIWLEFQLQHIFEGHRNEIRCCFRKLTVLIWRHIDGRCVEQVGAKHINA